MEEMHADNVISINHQSQDGWAKLIRKLHCEMDPEFGTS